MLERIAQRKKELLSALIGAVLASSGMTLTQYIQDTGQTELAVIDQIAQAIIIEQEKYFEIYGEYWQGLWTSTEIPKDETLIIPDLLNIKPNDVNKTWNDFVTLSSKLPYRIQVNVYSCGPGRDCKGWWIVFQKELGGIKFERSIGFGPIAEHYMEDWHIIPAKIK